LGTGISQLSVTGINGINLAKPPNPSGCFIINSDAIQNPENCRLRHQTERIFEVEYQDMPVTFPDSPPDACGNMVLHRCPRQGAFLRNRPIRSPAILPGSQETFSMFLNYMPDTNCDQALEFTWVVDWTNALVGIAFVLWYEGSQ